MTEFLNGKSKTITGAALILGAASLLSRFLGIIRDRILAGQFGAGEVLDVYYAAFRVPDFVYNLLVLGALSAGVIPVLAQLFCPSEGRDEKVCKKEAWGFVNNILNITLVSLLLISVLGFVLAPYLMP